MNKKIAKSIRGDAAWIIVLLEHLTSGSWRGTPRGNYHCYTKKQMKTMCGSALKAAKRVRRFVLNNS